MHAHAQLCYWPHFDWEVEIDFMGRIMYKLPREQHRFGYRIDDLFHSRLISYHVTKLHKWAYLDLLSALLCL